MKLNVDFNGYLKERGPFELALDTNKYAWRLNVDRANEVMLEETKPFTLRHQYFKSPQGALNTQWWSIYISKETPLMWLKCLSNPLESQQFIARVLTETHTDANTISGCLEPGKHPLNPTKTSQSWIKTLDSGRVIILEDSPLLKKFEFKGAHLKGLCILSREPEAHVWEFTRKEYPKK